MPSDQTPAPTAVARADAPRGRVVVAMSGGVNSSVVAALLKGQGHDVVGVTLQLYDHGAATGRRGACCAGQDIHDARRVADRLAIPHYVLDYEQRFRTGVMQAFADSYAAGETPIPCVTCNQRIKFRDLLETALELGADTLATGHYIERRDGPGGPAALPRPRFRPRPELLPVRHHAGAARPAACFPWAAWPRARCAGWPTSLGCPWRRRPTARTSASSRRGATPGWSRSCGLAAAEPGDIVHVDGRVLGRHQGIIHYTVGQRRGLGVCGQEPLYVVRLDPERREVIVGPRARLATRWLRLRDVNWLGDDPLSRDGSQVAARIRSTAPLQPATVYAGDARPDGSADGSPAATRCGCCSTRASTGWPPARRASSTPTPARVPGFWVGAGL